MIMKNDEWQIDHTLYRSPRLSHFDKPEFEQRERIIVSKTALLERRRIINCDDSGRDENDRGSD